MLRHNSAARFGYRTPVDLVVSRIDVHRPTARDLVYLSQRLGGEQIEQIRDGAVSYARVLEETRLAEAGASAEEITRTRDLDLDSVRRVLQDHRRMTRADEKRVFDSQYVAFQPSLDGTHVRVMGQLGAYEAEICHTALNRMGDELVPPGEPRPEPGLRRALALTALCQDHLDQHSQPGPAADRVTSSPGGRREPLLMVVARNPLVETSSYEQGTAMLAGARVGPDTVDLIRCSGRTETITVAGQNVTHHGSTTNIRPPIRRAVLARDDGCTIDGCNSTYRLEVHHILERSKGGDHSPENLATLCWWHHHVAVHRQGMRIDPQTPIPTPPQTAVTPPQNLRLPAAGIRPPHPGHTPSTEHQHQPGATLTVPPRPRNRTHQPTSGDQPTPAPAAGAVIQLAN